jgi:hypothetical protein
VMEDWKNNLNNLSYEQMNTEIKQASTSCDGHGGFPMPSGHSGPLSIDISAKSSRYGAEHAGSAFAVATTNFHHSNISRRHSCDIDGKR